MLLVLDGAREREHHEVLRDRTEMQSDQDGMREWDGRSQRGRRAVGGARLVQRVVTEDALSRLPLLLILPVQRLVLSELGPHEVDDRPLADVLQGSGAAQDGGAIGWWMVRFGMRSSERRDGREGAQAPGRAPEVRGW